MKYIHFLIKPANFSEAERLFYILNHKKFYPLDIPETIFDENGNLIEYDFRQYFKIINKNSNGSVLIQTREYYTVSDFNTFIIPEVDWEMYGLNIPEVVGSEIPEVNGNFILDNTFESYNYNKILSIPTPFEAIYDFNQSYTHVFTNPPTGIDGITFGNFSATTNLTRIGGGASHAFYGWYDSNGDNTNIDNTKYYEVTISPTGDNIVIIDKITFSINIAGSSTTQPKKYVMRYSINNYETNLSANVISPASDRVEILDNNVFHIYNTSTPWPFRPGNEILLNLEITIPITFRLYAYNAAANNSSTLFNIDDFTFIGKTVK